MDHKPVDIKVKSRNSDWTAPTPNNTPSVFAPINSSMRPPSLSKLDEEADSSGDQQLFQNLQGKLGSFAEESAQNIKNLPVDVKRRIYGLKHLQSKHAELELKFHEEILELEKKYLELYRPLYQKRQEFVTGGAEPTEEEVESGKQADEELTEDLEDGEDESEQGPTKGVPSFWLTVLKNHVHLAELISAKDEGVLKHLVDVRLGYLENNPGFKLEFDFEENEYFTNKVLVKSYFYQESASSGDLVFDHAEGTEIQWKEGKDLSTTVESKKQKHKGTNQTRVVKRTVQADTFFNFFTPIVVPDVTNISEAEERELSERLEADYELGEEFKEKIIPHAIDWFTGKALQYEDFGMDYAEEEFYDDTTDDEEGLDSDEGSDEETQSNEKPQECKQQ
ncbi:NAP-domain-containing protein [Basidiobolus meristosporus CBS 931.73]|uniref:NAP-domain-containing protein n=1 Tax=Basidiobolus meristosporus CBS 931.73 TaxID=1314790 RepID=A0A1Y1XTQ7_9FUNG|nr:NAP-domain-containing protein [Basidiobolus meristosporus CBS 931.73]|eukprot:ORX89108.1 NAP-domain-containing protein [Basidiobolus meristosporus CBS 931.73]